LGWLAGWVRRLGCWTRKYLAWKIVHNHVHVHHVHGFVEVCQEDRRGPLG
jgi:hypothetical protein